MMICEGVKEGFVRVWYVKAKAVETRNATVSARVCRRCMYPPCAVDVLGPAPLLATRRSCFAVSAWLAGIVHLLRGYQTIVSLDPRVSDPKS